MKILAIGDLHAKDFLSYSEYILDKRESEKKEILDFIVNQSIDCHCVVFLGDLFHSKNNSSKTNKWVVEFLERFEGKSVFIISGNHDKAGDGSTSIDFLRAIKNKPNWRIFTKPDSEKMLLKNQEVGLSTISKDYYEFDFLPYMLNSELGAENSQQATEKIMDGLKGGNILFTHHNITGTSIFEGITTNMMKGVVLPKEELEKKYKLIFAGDIHTPQQYGNVTITGSVFTTEVGEHEKFIWKIDDNMNVEKIKLPCREIWKIENPTEEQLAKIPDSSIVKVVLTDRNIDVDSIKELLKKFDASLIVEDYPSERKKMHIEEGAFDFEISSLLKLYAEEKDVSYEKLMKGLELINA